MNRLLLTTSTLTLTLTLLPLTMATTGCDTRDQVGGDQIDDSFFGTGGKADSAGVVEGSADAQAVLDLVNRADRRTLEVDVGLSESENLWRAADNIVVYREGDDRVVGTDDDELFDSLAELDAIPYVGPIVFGLLLEHVRYRPDPFDPASCSGPFLGDDAFDYLGPAATNRELGTATTSVMSRRCTSVSCTEWERCDKAGELPWAACGQEFKTSLRLRGGLNLRISNAECEIQSGGFGLCRATDGQSNSWILTEVAPVNLTRECFRFTGETTSNHGNGTHYEFRYAVLGMMPAP